MRRIPFDELRGRVEHVMLELGLVPERAALSARLTAETDRDGVRTHGIARLPRFARGVRDGLIDPKAQPECVTGFGAMERWTGHRGPGNLAAYAAMRRAIDAWFAQAGSPRPDGRNRAGGPPPDSRSA